MKAHMTTQGPFEQVSLLIEQIEFRHREEDAIQVRNHALEMIGSRRIGHNHRELNIP